MARNEVILLTGARGRLGKSIMAVSHRRGWALNDALWVRPPREELDITKEADWKKVFRTYRPTIVIHAAGFANTMACEADPERAYAANVWGTRFGVLQARENKARFVHISTDYVFDGRRAPYNEYATPFPINYYGYTKAVADELVLGPRNLIIRVPFRVRPWRYPNAFADQFTSCRWVDEVGGDVIVAALSELDGILHIGGPRRSILEMARSENPNIPTSMRYVSGLKLPHDTTLVSNRWERWKEKQNATSAEGNHTRRGTP